MTSCHEAFRSLDIVEVLDCLGVENIQKSSEDHLRAFCPIHKSDKQRSFSLSLKDGVWLWKCFSCEESGDIISLIRKLKKEFSFKKALSFLFQFLGKDVNFEDFISLDFISFVKPKEEKIELQEEDFEVSLEYIRSYHPYFKNRGITKRNIEEFDLGFCRFGRMKNRVIFPIKELQKSKAFSGRTILEKDKEEKYLYYPAGTKVHSYLYNIDNLVQGNELILCEGFFDAIQIYNFGFKNVAALMGSDISDVQEIKIWKLNPNNLLLCFDGDKAGRKLIEKIFTRFFGKMNIKIMLFNSGLDPADLTLRQFEKLYKNSFSSEEYLEILKGIKSNEK